MTLRQYLNRAVFQDFYFLLMVCSWICIVALIFLLRSTPGVAALVCLPSVLLMYIYTPQLFRLVRCPRCHGRLEELAYVAIMSNGVALNDGGHLARRPLGEPSVWASARSAASAWTKTLRPMSHELLSLDSHTWQIYRGTQSATLSRPEGFAHRGEARSSGTCRDLLQVSVSGASASCWCRCSQ
jgi:hypothetical protein